MRVADRRRLAAVIAALALVFPLASCHGETEQDVSVGEEQETTPPRPTPSATTTPPEEAQPSEPPATAAPVSTPMAAPTKLSVPRIGLEAGIEEFTNEMVENAGGAVDPPKFDTVSWWSGGGTPGTDADNTVYLYGHTWIEPAVFNRIKELVPGDEVFVTTSNGVLQYVVDGSFQIAKPDLPGDKRVHEIVPGRLLLIGCWRETGDELVTTDNVVVIAHLAS